MYVGREGVEGGREDEKEKKSKGINIEQREGRGGR
jgi:hypothetical protein